MGDRRNVLIDQQDDRPLVALYTHWTGSVLPQTVAAALDRGRGRWTDPAYLTRIIFSEMIKGDVRGETGYGIEAVERGKYNYCEADPGYDIEVNVPEQQVGWDETWYSFDYFVEHFKE